MKFIPDVPRWVQEQLAIRRVKEKQLATNSKVEFSLRDTRESEKSDPSPINEKNLRNDLSSIAAAKLTSQYNSSFGFNPMTLSTIVLMPQILEKLSISHFYYIPIAMLFLSYLQNIKDSADRKASVGIVSDPAMIKVIIDEMPKWTIESDFQRMEWFNSVLQTLWPYISSSCQDLVLPIVKPILKQYKPAFLTNLELTTFHLGSIAPSITGITI